ncbi:hypothetical protein ASPCAL10174 [Aspergillus calidoustus]|uniref:Uncharacterized protein n=1 Tax=Aspergillus calidoustus TaxID=454130 RepID=A0A0U5G5J0_ASPCI|nr:hypothetical protein ASPCAL10174 [Aspergillus calidoustus]
MRTLPFSALSAVFWSIGMSPTKLLYRVGPTPICIPNPCPVSSYGRHINWNEHDSSLHRLLSETTFTHTTQVASTTH